MGLHKVHINDFFFGLTHTVSYLVKVQISLAGALLCLTLQAASFTHIKPRVYLHTWAVVAPEPMDSMLCPSTFEKIWRTAV